VVLTTQGRPVSPADEIRIDAAAGEAGELLVRGPCTVRGYYRSPEHNALAFTPDGFFRTGALARLTAEGNLVVE
jgi:2,3-dihydroxybenzoate-AMP ligase